MQCPSRYQRRSLVVACCLCFSSRSSRHPPRCGHKPLTSRSPRSPRGPHGPPTHRRKAWSSPAIRCVRARSPRRRACSAAMRCAAPQQHAGRNAQWPAGRQQSSYFGPNASRPVIRGQDGDRIRILQNGGASLDASTLSYDHAVPVDPLVTERIEVLRGPSALQYGGSAVGGVVNVIDNRIPNAPIEGLPVAAPTSAAPATGARRRAARRRQRPRGDPCRCVLARNHGHEGADLRTVEPRCRFEPQARSATRPARTDGGALGGSLFFDQGYFGASVAPTAALRHGGRGRRDDRHVLEQAHRRW